MNGSGLVYADAYQWVELPNVSGMILFADGGMLASKPYAASGAYINKMSNYCAKVAATQSPRKMVRMRVPFNYLYWDFLMRPSGRTSRQPSHGDDLPQHLLKMSPERVEATKKKTANAFYLLLLRGPGLLAAISESMSRYITIIPDRMPLLGIDLGYSAKTKSCGLARSGSQDLHALGFGECIDYTAFLIGEHGPHVLILEAVLSTYHRSDGNPDIRGDFEKGAWLVSRPGCDDLRRCFALP